MRFNESLYLIIYMPSKVNIGGMQAWILLLHTKAFMDSGSLLWIRRVIMLWFLRFWSALEKMQGLHYYIGIYRQVIRPSMAMHLRKILSLQTKMDCTWDLIFILPGVCSWIFISISSNSPGCVIVL